MKKRTFFTIIIAILFIIVGGIGVFVTQNQLVEEREQNAVNKKILTKKNKELEIRFDSPTMVTITRSDDKHIYMNKQGVDFKLDKKKQADCTFTEKDSTSLLTIKNPSTETKGAYPFSIFSLNRYIDDTVYLRVPTHYETVIVNGEMIHLSMYDFSADTITLSLSNGSVSLDNIRAKKLIQTEQATDFIIENSKISEQLSISSQYNDITILNSTAKLMTLKTEIGSIFTGNTKGDMEVNTQEGDVSINHTTGKSTIHTIHGDILFHDNTIDFDTELISTNGDIDIETDNASIESNQLNFETTLGDISIFNKNLSSDRKYKTNKGKISIKAMTKNGDIDVEELDTDDTHYGYD